MKQSSAEFHGASTNPDVGVYHLWRKHHIPYPVKQPNSKVTQIPKCQGTAPYFSGEMTCSAGKRVNHHVQTNGKWAKVKPMPSKTTNRVWVHWCPSFGLCPDYIFPIFFNDSKLFLVINKLNQLKHNFYWTIIIYCTIRYILILNASPFDMGKKMVHVKLGITISQPLFSADVPLCF